MKGLKVLWGLFILLSLNALVAIGIFFVGLFIGQAILPPDSWNMGPSVFGVQCAALVGFVQLLYVRRYERLLERKQETSMRQGVRLAAS